jgi:D-3-phosphoglycerate dehydrogenase
MKVLITDKMAKEAIQLIEDAGHEVTYDEEMDGDTLLKEIPNYDGLMVRGRTKVVTDIVNAGKSGNLKVIGRAGVGVDNVDIKTAAKNDIKVVNAPTGSTQSVAELAISHMLALIRYIPKSDSSMKKGEWLKKQLKGTELFGKTVGLIGSGNISQHVAKCAKGFGMKVLVYSPHCTDEKAKKMGATRVELDDLLKNSDFVSIHIPHTEKSHYLLNYEKLTMMKNSAYLINCSRGGVVEDEALYKILSEGKIAGAGIDVFEKEPPTRSKLLKLDNAILTPHLGANTKEAQIRAGTDCAAEILKVLNGKEPTHWVNKNLM